MILSSELVPFAEVTVCTIIGWVNSCGVLYTKQPGTLQASQHMYCMCTHGVVACSATSLFVLAVWQEPRTFHSVNHDYQWP